MSRSWAFTFIHAGSSDERPPPIKSCLVSEGRPASRSTGPTAETHTAVLRRGLSGCNPSSKHDCNTNTGARPHYDAFYRALNTYELMAGAFRTAGVHRRGPTNDMAHLSSCADEYDMGLVSNTPEALPEIRLCSMSTINSSILGDESISQFPNEVQDPRQPCLPPR